MSEQEWLENFRYNLVCLVRDYGLSQRELAEDSGLSETTISRYMSGLQMPSVRAVVNIAIALDIPVDQLVNFDEIIY